MVFVLCTSSDHAIYLYQVSQKYLKEFQSYGADMISIPTFTKGHNSVKKLKLWFLIYVYCLGMLHFCTKFRKSISKVSQLLGKHEKNYKGALFQKKEYK